MRGALISFVSIVVAKYNYDDIFSCAYLWNERSVKTLAVHNKFQLLYHVSRGTCIMYLYKNESSYWDHS